MMRTLGAVLCAVAASFAAAAFAQDYPSKPVRILVPFAPGGAVDTTARILSSKMTERLGWQFVVENRPGGNGFIGTTAAAKSPPDGYTLLMAHTGEFSVNPALFKDVPYDLDRDFVAITMVSDGPLLYLANAQTPFNTLPEFIAAAKARPDTITFGSGGNGTINHLAGEWLAYAAKVKLVHVPYKGGAPAATAVAAGDVQFGVIAVPGATPHLRSGRAKVLGISSARKWSPEPGWATPRDVGLDVDASIWSGLFAPKGTPQAVVDRWNAEVRKTLEQPDVRARFVDAGFDTAGMSQADFVARIRRDLERYREIVKAAGIKAE